MNLETVAAALSLAEAGEDFAWATIIASRGSSPRHVDTSMLVRTDGSISGTIGGGPLEAAVIKDSLSVLAASATHLMDFDSTQLGMACGGGGLVLIEYVDSTRAEVPKLYRELHRLLAEGGKGWLVALVREEDGGRVIVDKCLVEADGSVLGDPVLPLDILQELARTGDASTCVVAGRVSRTYVQPVGVRGSAYVFGAGHCGEKLVPVLGDVGFFTVVVDDRAEFANPQRFPTADRIVVPESFADVLATLPVDEDSYIVIVTRGHTHDKDVLRQALKTPAAYIGMMGSKKKVADISRALEAEGVSPQTLAAVHMPIGLSIGAETPEEIAISIAAELIQVRAAKDG
jgi:xanthine dehydrogenase accessory factor